MSASDSATLDADEIFEILSSQRRRMVLYYLRQNDQTGTMKDLARQIAAWENDVPIEDLTSQQRKRVYVSLYQTHLPKLADTGLIDYDSDAGDVRLTDRATDMDAFLTPTEDSEYSWRRHYVGLLTIGGGVMLLAVFGMPFVGETTLLFVAIALLIGYLIMVGLEYWYRQRTESSIPSELEPQQR